MPTKRTVSYPPMPKGGIAFIEIISDPEGKGRIFMLQPIEKRLVSLYGGFIGGDILTDNDIYSVHNPMERASTYFYYALMGDNTLKQIIIDWHSKRIYWSEDEQAVLQFSLVYTPIDVKGFEDFFKRQEIEEIARREIASFIAFHGISGEGVDIELFNYFVLIAGGKVRGIPTHYLHSKYDEVKKHYAHFVLHEGMVFFHIMTDGE